MRHLALTLLALVALLFAAGPQQALACVCMPLSSSEQAVRRHLDGSDALFIGTVLRGDARTGFHVLVLRAYQGVRGGETAVLFPDPSSCAYPSWRPWSDHLFSVTTRAGHSVVAMCDSFPIALAPAVSVMHLPRASWMDPTVQPDSNGQFIAALNRLVPPDAPPTQPAGRPYGDHIMDARNDGPRWLFPAIAIALLLAATGAVVTLTARRQ